MTDTIPQSIGLMELAVAAKSLLAMMAVCAARIYAAMLVLPATNDQLLTGIVRNGVVLIVSFFLAFGQPAEWVVQLNAPQLALVMLKEALVGLLIGFAVSTVFWTAEAIGMLIDNCAGFNNVQQTNPTSGQASTPVGNLLLQMAIMGFYTLGGMTVFIGLLIDSFAWWPLNGAVPDWAVLAKRFIPSETATWLETVLKIAGPMIVTLLLIDIGMGVMAKAAEKLEPHTLSQPIKGAVAILLLALLIGVFFEQVRHELSLHRPAQRLEKLLAPPSLT